MILWDLTIFSRAWYIFYAMLGCVQILGVPKKSIFIRFTSDTEIPKYLFFLRDTLYFQSLSIAFMFVHPAWTSLVLDVIEKKEDCVRQLAKSLPQ